MILPIPHDDHQLESGHIPPEISSNLISPWWYHVILSKTALVYHRLVHAVRKKEGDLEVLVRKADEGLANVIDSLPLHLQPFADQSPESLQLEQEYPWIRWQRIDRECLSLTSHPVLILL